MNMYTSTLSTTTLVAKSAKDTCFQFGETDSAVTDTALRWCGSGNKAVRQKKRARNGEQDKSVSNRRGTHYPTRSRTRTGNVSKKDDNSLFVYGMIKKI